MKDSKPSKKKKGKHGGARPGAGRPASPHSRRELVVLRVSTAERAQLEQDAVTAGVTLTELVRGRVLVRR